MLSSVACPTASTVPGTNADVTCKGHAASGKESVWTLIRAVRRRTIVAIASTAALLVSLTLILPSQADPVAGNPGGSVFELDGNANNGPAAGEDWSNVYTNFLAGSTTNSPSFVAEPGRSDSIFTGGGSKDPNDISSWAWKNGGGLPDKDNLLDAFAGRYGDLLVFGSDRFDNSGDAQQGFWFFQDEVSLNPNGSFNGTHMEGDLLILSDFSIGGTVSSIAVYKWVASGGNISTHLQSLFDSESANCGSAGTGDVCGIVNASSTTGNQTGGWAFRDKSGNTTYLQGEFFEGGLNLAPFGLAGQCFASFASETRSSRSPTATLKDVIIGGFQRCDSAISTTQSWVPNDSATISVPRANTWAGQVVFSLYPTIDCSGTALYTETKTASNASPTVSTANDGSSTDGDPGYTAIATGSFSWGVSFTPTTTGVNPSTHCESTDLTITN